MCMVPPCLKLHVTRDVARGEGVGCDTYIHGYSRQNEGTGGKRKERKGERKTMEWGKNREIRKEKKERRNKERRGGRKKGEEER